MRSGALLALVALFVVSVVALLAALAVKAEGPNWNAPEPAIMRLPFPSSQEAAAKAVAATSEERAEGMKWIAEFLKPEAMPPGLEEHLLALKDAIPNYPMMIGSGYPISSDAPPDALKMAPGFAEGNYALDPEQMRRSAFAAVTFATDGKGVIFEAYKNLPLPSDYMKPRFSALAAPHGD